MRAFVIVSLLVAACGDDDSGSRAQGELGGLCYPNGTCNVTLVCQSGLCMASGDGGTLGDATPSDGVSGQCADDSVLEPNESIATAWVTPVDATKNFPLSSLAICPAGDKDTYSVSITTANEGLEAIVEYVWSPPMLQASILNSGGIAIANASTTTAGTIRAYAPNLPTGTYYVQVQSGTGGTNNYKLTLNIIGP